MNPYQNNLKNFSPVQKQKKKKKRQLQLDGSLPANPVNDRRTANAVTLKSTFCLP